MQFVAEIGCFSDKQMFKHGEAVSLSMPIGALLLPGDTNQHCPMIEIFHFRFGGLSGIELPLAAPDLSAFFSHLCEFFLKGDQS